MQAPRPIKQSECEQCLKVKPLLMPVSFIPGWPIVVWGLLCVDCRLNVRLSKHSDNYCEPGEMWQFSHRKEQRDAYDEWLAVESF